MPINNKIENDIVNAIRNSNNNVWNYICKTYYKMIEHFIIINSGNVDDAKDIFQESLLAIYINFKRENFQLTTSFKTYLYQINRNLWFSELKKRNNTINSVKDIIIREDSENYEINNEVEENYSKIEEVINRLGEKCKLIIELYYYKKHRLSEIANQLNYISENSVKTQKYKCLQQIKQMMK